VDDDGFREFVELRYVELLRTAYLLTGARPAAEDLVQTALLRAMRRWSKIDDPVAYLRRVMVNQRTSGWRRAVRLTEQLTAHVPERAGGVDVADQVATRDELVRALGTLPPRMRAVLVLRYWEDQSEVETAELLGCSVGTVKSQASRGLARLRMGLQVELATTGVRR
jgi:RNA polymerase sigma-70 factor (sigma-E family)